MSRRVHLLLIAGCVVIGALELPAALRSLGETWRGPYALDSSAQREASPTGDSEAQDAVASPAGTRPLLSRSLPPIGT